MGLIFPLWTLKASKFPVAEIIYPNNLTEYYPIKAINNEFFIIKKVGVFRLADGVAKVLDGKVRIFQYCVESPNPIDARYTKTIYDYCKKHKLPELTPLLMEQAQTQNGTELVINEPLPPRPILYLRTFKSFDPTHVYNFWVAMDQAHKEANKWISKKMMPKIEAKYILFGVMALLILIFAVPIALEQYTSITGGFDITKSIFGEMVLGAKMFMASAKAHFIAGAQWFLK
jgi:hypothetical protein